MRMYSDVGRLWACWRVRMGASSVTGTLAGPRAHCGSGPSNPSRWIDCWARAMPAAARTASTTTGRVRSFIGPVLLGRGLYHGPGHVTRLAVVRGRVIFPGLPIPYRYPPFRRVPMPEAPLPAGVFDDLARTLAAAGPDAAADLLV